jgi:hypothetical protein
MTIAVVEHPWSLMLMRSTSMIIYAEKPYTYLIGWSKLDKWYYGVRYSKQARTDELWVKYFTSSKHVARFRNKHGEPDVIQVRKTFKDKQEAIDWEQRVLRRMNVEKDSRFINAKNDTTKTPTSFPEDTRFKPGHVPWCKGLSFKEMLSEEERKKFGHTATDDERQSTSALNKLLWQDNEQRRLEWSMRTKTQFADPIEKEKHRSKCVSHRDRIWITDGSCNKRIFEQDLNEYPGWRKGRFIPRETVDKMTAGRTMKGV